MLTPYFTIGTGKVVSHITRVNSIGNSSKIIFPKEIISTLDLDWEDDYIEWRIESRNGVKRAIIQKFDVLSSRKAIR